MPGTVQGAKNRRKDCDPCLHGDESEEETDIEMEKYVSVQKGSDREMQCVMSVTSRLQSEKASWKSCYSNRQVELRVG